MMVAVEEIELVAEAAPPSGDDAGEPQEDVVVEMQMKEMVEVNVGGGDD
jgi:hypothetical protein